MDLHLFFKGKLKREEVASAFLATLLEQRKDVRDAFFDMLADCSGEGFPDYLKAKSWEVQVEVGQVDIRLIDEDGAWVVLVENKLQAGAKQSGQLRRYYLSHLQKDPRQHVGAVYLAPGAMGKREVKFPELRDGDFAVHLSWDTVIKRLQTLELADPEGFTASGTREITKAIEDAAKEKYPNEGERNEVHDVVSVVRDNLQRRFRTIRIGHPWPAKDRFTLAASGTNLTLWLTLSFYAGPNPPYAPINLFSENEKMCLTMHSMLKLSARGRRKPELKRRWDEQLHKELLDVPGVGIHKLRGRWFVLEQQHVATSDCMIKDLTGAGAALLQVVENWGSASH